MAEGVKKNGHRIFFAAVAILLLLLAFAGYRTLRRSAGLVFGDFFYPYLFVAKSASNQVSDQTLLLYNRTELAARVEQLLRVNRQLGAQAAEAANLRQENEELRRNSGLQSESNWRYLTSEIIMRDPLLWNEHFTVNRGSADGVVPGAAAMTVTAEGLPVLIGVVDQVGRHTSQITTLFSPGLRLSAALPGTGVSGVINAGERHSVSGCVPIGLLPAHLRYTPREALFSTGYERNIPRGIKIGELESVEDTPSRFSHQLYLSGLLKPAARLDSIRFLILALRRENHQGGGRTPDEDLL